MNDFIYYDTLDGSSWRARLEPVTVSEFIGIVVHTPDPIFEHFAESSNSSHRDSLIKYITAGGSKWMAKIIGRSTFAGPQFKFLHAPIDDSTWSRAHEDGKIIYMYKGEVNSAFVVCEHDKGASWKVGFRG